MKNKMKFDEWWEDHKDTLSITVKELAAEVWYASLEQVQEDLDRLSCLEAAGVDNWEGIDYAYELMEEINNPKPKSKFPKKKAAKIPMSNIQEICSKNVEEDAMKECKTEIDGKVLKTIEKIVKEDEPEDFLEEDYYPHNPRGV